MKEKLSRYVYKALDKTNTEVYYNSVTCKTLPLTANYGELQEELFLAGQERESLFHRLFKKSNVGALTVIPSWQCNLRCTHCVVADRLGTSCKEDFDVNKFIKFITHWVEVRNLTAFRVDFSGGEVLLSADKNLEIMQAVSRLPIKSYFSCYTNLAMDLTEKHFEFFSKLDRFGISLDGDELLHNAQRIPNLEKINVFEKVIDNIKKLIMRGFFPKMGLQCCLADDVYNQENLKKFLRVAFKLGFKINQVRAGTACPTKQNPIPSESFVKEIKGLALRTMFCCKYRLYTYQVDSVGNIFSDYYNYTKVGSLDDTIEILENNKIELIIKEMPLLTDVKCIQCPVVGFCWAGCTTVDAGRDGHKWSDFCNQEALIEYAKNPVIVEAK